MNSSSISDIENNGEEHNHDPELKLTILVLLYIILALYSIIFILLSKNSIISNIKHYYNKIKNLCNKCLLRFKRRSNIESGTVNNENFVVIELDNIEIKKVKEFPENLDLNCSICLDKIDKKQLKNSTYLNCNHAFHLECINKWTINKNTCPNCREPITIKYTV
jgi:hypothetical protein